MSLFEGLTYEIFETYEKSDTKYSILCNYFIITMELMIYRQKSTLFLHYLKVFRALIYKKKNYQCGLECPALSLSFGPGPFSAYC